MQVFEQINNIGRRLETTSKTITGSAELLAWNGTPAVPRQGVLICNNDATLSVYLKLSTLSNGETVSATDCDLVLQPLRSVQFNIGENINIWAANSSGSTTVSSISGLEVGH